MDKLLFKRKTSKTTPETVGADHEYILAETIINDRPFLDYFEGQHRYDYNLAVCLYRELIGASEAYDYVRKQERAFLKKPVPVLIIPHRFHHTRLIHS